MSQVDDLYPKCVKPQFPDRFNGIAILGEAPGAEEETQGTPFVGSSGKLLNRMLIDAKIDRRDCLILNVFDRRPPQNKIKAFFSHGSKTILPYGKLHGLRLHSMFDNDLCTLRSRLRVWEPNVIVAMGRTAAWASLGQTSPIGVMHAENPHRSFDWLYLKSKVLVNYHPSYLLRLGQTEQGALYDTCVAVFKRARSLIYVQR